MQEMRDEFAALSRDDQKWRLAQSLEAIITLAKLHGMVVEVQRTVRLARAPDSGEYSGIRYEYQYSVRDDPRHPNYPFDVAHHPV